MKQPSFVATTHIRTADVLVIVLYDQQVDTTGDSPLVDDNPRSESWAGKAITFIDGLSFSHVP